MLLGATGCMMGPGNDTRIATTGTAIEFYGYLVEPNAPVDILSSPTKTGAFVRIASTRSAASPSRVNGDGVTLYAYQVSAVIQAFSSACGGREAFVKAMSNRLTLITFDRRNETQVGGDAFFDFTNTVDGATAALQNVGGDFTLVGGNPNASSFPALRTIGGDMTLEQPWFGFAESTRKLPSLASVAGQLEWNAVRNNTSLRVGATAGLSLGSLSIHDNLPLSTLDAGNIRVSATGRVTITNDPALCESLVDAFLDGLVGWTGPSTVSGNRSGC